MSESPTEQHRRQAESLPPVRAAVLTISDTRTPETDESGRIISQLFAEAGHTVVHYYIVPDEPSQIRSQVEALCNSGEIDVLLTNGGTGISPRDSTYEAIEGLLRKTIPGFGEFFRNLSWDEVGTAAMLSRATAGLCENVLVFAMPGSPNAVNLAVTELILPEIKHLVFEMKKA